MRYEIRPKNRWTLVGIEILLVSTGVIAWLYKKYHWDFATALVWWVVAVFTLSFLFFGVRIFRYLFSIAFSLLWGGIGFSVAHSATKSTVTPWIAAIIVIFISLFLHKDYFQFERGDN